MFESLILLLCFCINNFLLSDLDSSGLAHLSAFPVLLERKGRCCVGRVAADVLFREETPESAEC